MTMVQPYAPGVIDEHREAGRLARDGDHEPGAARHAVRRAARLRRRRRHPLGDATTAPTPARSTARSCGAGASSRPCGRGPRTSGIDLRGLVRLQRQLLRRPAARRRRPPGGRQPRRPPRRAGPRCAGWPLRHFDLPEGVPKIAGRELQEWTRFRCSGPSCWPTSASTSPASRRSPTTGPVIAVFNHRSYFDGTVVGTVLGQTGRSFRFLGKKEVFDAPVIGVPLEDGRRHPRQPLVGLGRAAGGGDQGAAAPARRSPWRRRARSRAARRSSTPMLQGPLGRGPPRRRPRAPGHPGRAVGHREGVAAQLAAAPVRLRRAARDPGARRRPGAAASTAASTPTPSGSWRRSSTSCRPRPRASSTPTAEELAATYPPGYKGDPTPRPTAARAPTPDRCDTRAGDGRRRAQPTREQRFERRMSDAEALMWNVEKDPWLNPSGGDVDRSSTARSTSTTSAPSSRRPSPTVPRLMEHVVGGRRAASARRCGGPTPSSTSTTTSLRWPCRRPGTMRQLLDLCAAIYQDPYDRTRPLWMYLRHRGSGGRPGGDGVEDPPRRRRRHRRGAPGRGVHPADPRGARAARRRPRRGARRRRRGRRRREHGRTSLVETVVGTVTHFARRQAGIARRVVGEVAMWGADPLRARDAVGGVVAHRRPAPRRSCSAAAAAEEPRATRARPQLPGGSPLWRNRSRHRHLEVLSFPLDAGARRGQGPRRLAQRLVRHRASSTASSPTTTSAACRCAR